MTSTSPIRPGPRLPPGQQLGQVTAVAATADGEIYVLHRGTPPVLCFDRDGQFLRAWGDTDILAGGGHFLRIDPEDHPWVADTSRHQVLKFDREGVLLAALGRRHQAGDAPDQFDQPTDLAFLPSGDFFVSDGYGNARIKKYTADCELITMWGRRGRLPGEFDTPHTLCLDTSGTLYISDRGNSRIQVYAPDGRFLAEWRAFPPVDGLACAADGSLFAATGRANGFVRLSTIEFEGNGEGREPIVLESAGNGYCTYRELVGHVVPPAGQFNMIHGIAVDANGDVYVAEVRARRAQKLIRRRPFRAQQQLARASRPGNRDEQEER